MQIRGAVLDYFTLDAWLWGFWISPSSVLLPMWLMYGKGSLRMSAIHVAA
jgi:hypothetical protein